MNFLLCKLLNHHKWNDNGICVRCGVEFRIWALWKYRYMFIENDREIAKRSPELSRTCPFNPKSRCNVPIAEPCSNCKVWQEAREMEHEDKMNEAANIEDYWKHLGNED